MMGNDSDQAVGKQTQLTGIRKEFKACLTDPKLSPIGCKLCQENITEFRSTTLCSNTSDIGLPLLVKCHGHSPVISRRAKLLG